MTGRSDPSSAVWSMRSATAPKSRPSMPSYASSRIPSIPSMILRNRWCCASGVQAVKTRSPCPSGQSPWRSIRTTVMQKCSPSTASMVEPCKASCRGKIQVHNPTPHVNKNSVVTDCAVFSCKYQYNAIFVHNNIVFQNYPAIMYSVKF